MADDSRFVIRSELMQGYLPEQSVYRGAALTCTQDRAGGVQLFSAGTDDVYNYRPDASSSSGWSLYRMHAPVAPTAVAAGRDRTGAMIVMIADVDNQLWWISDRPWDVWHSLGTPFGLVNGASSGYNEILDIAASYGSEGELVMTALCAVIYEGEQIQTIVLNVDWLAEQPYDYLTPGITPTVYGHQPGTWSRGTGVWISYQDFQPDTILTFIGDNGRVLDSRHVPTAFSNSQLFGATRPTGSTRLFLRTPSGRVGQYDLQFNQVVPIDMASGAQSEMVAVAVGYTQSGGRSLAIMLGVDASGQLYAANEYVDLEAAELPAPAPTGWFGFVPLAGADVVADPKHLCTTVDDAGLSHFYVSTASGDQLVDIWLDENGEWQFDSIEVGYDFEVDPAGIPVYATDIGITDEYGNPSPFEPLTLYVSRTTRLQVNGETVLVSVNEGFVTQTNSGGRINVVVPTDSLGTPSLEIAAGFLDDDDRMAIQPDRYVQITLHPDTPEDLVTTLADAKVDDEPLIPSEYQDDIDAVANAVWSSLTVAEPDPDAEQLAAPRLLPGSDRAGVYLRKPGSAPAGKIVASRVPKQHWVIDFRDERPLFRRFDSHDELQRWRAERRASFGRTVGGARLFGHGKPSWGTLWNGVKHGASELADLVVSTVDTIVVAGEEVVQRVESSISLLIDEVEQAFDYVVDTVEQCFDMVEGVFEQIAVTFERLYDWLASVFDWDAILATQQQIVEAVTDGFTTVYASLGSMQTTIDAALNSLAANIAGSLGSVGDATSNDTRSQALEQLPGQAPGPSSNWAMDQLVNSGGGAPVDDQVELDTGDAAATGSYIDSLWDRLGGPGLQLSSQLNAWFEDGGTLGGSTLNQLQQLAIEVLTEALIPAVQAVVDEGFALAEQSFHMIQDLLSQPWEVPVLSSLWRSVTDGEELTLLNLLALVIAIPTRVVTSVLDLASPDAELATSRSRALDVDLNTTAQVAFTFSNFLKSMLDAAGAYMPRKPAWFRWLGTGVGTVNWVLASAFPAGEPFDRAQTAADVSWGYSGFMVLVNAIFTGVAVRSGGAKAAPNETTVLIQGEAPKPARNTNFNALVSVANSVLAVGWLGLFIWNLSEELIAYAEEPEPKPGGGKSLSAILVRGVRNGCRTAAPIFGPVTLYKGEGELIVKTIWAELAGISGAGVAVLTWANLYIGGHGD